MKWLNALFVNENAMEWHGFNRRNAENEHALKRSASTYMFGPLIDAKDSMMTSSNGTIFCVSMMTSSNGNIFRVTGPLCGEFTGHRSPVNSSHKGQWRGALMFCLICALIKRLSKQSWGWWFETPTRAHYDVIIMSLRHSAYFNGPPKEVPGQHWNDLCIYICQSLIVYGGLPNQIDWHTEIQNIILRLWIMHTVQSFCGCIGKLKQRAGIENLINSAFSCLSGMLSGKAWVRAMHAFRIISTVLQRNFLSTG